MSDAAAPAEAIDLEAIDYGSGASILIFTDDPHRRDQIGALVRAAGGRVSASLGLGAAIDRIEAHAKPDGVVVDIRSGQPDLAEQIFDVLEQGARAQRFRSVALIPPEMIDLAMARIAHRDIELLCDDAGMDLVAVLSDLVAPRALYLSDVSADAAPVKLRELSEQVGRIARALAMLSRGQEGQHGGVCGNGAGIAPPAGDEGRLVDAVDVDLVFDASVLRATIRARRLRDQFFGSEIFADPAWDMLLDLMAARLEGRSVAVSSLCIASAVPPTTALRWIKTMTDIGLFTRVADPKDRRRVFIELAPRAVEAMGAYLVSAHRLTPLAS